MEAQLARYQNTFQKSVVKARFGFPEIIRGPSPLLGGTFLVLTVRREVGRESGREVKWKSNEETDYSPHHSLPPSLLHHRASTSFTAGT